MKQVTLKCPVCAGEGVIPDSLSDGLIDMVCPACQGEGWLDAETEDEDEDIS